MIRQNVKIAIGWHGLPAYAARLIKAVPLDFPVVASRPDVPIAGMDQILPGRIRWVETDDRVTWADMGIEIPDLYFQPSWSTPVFNRLGDQVNAAGGKVVVLFDNQWKGSLRQQLGALTHRILWRRRFAAAWVAGASGKRLARFWGFPEDRVYTGMYGSDPAIFGGHAERTRRKRFIFVGRLIERKGIRELASAWRLLQNVNSDWELHIYGAGPMEPELAGLPGVVVHGFRQPPIIAEALREAWFLVLPSHEEHWGLVVCEAAQSGCGLILSDKVGSHSDLLLDGNGFLFEAGCDVSLAHALESAISLSRSELEVISATSLANGLRFTPTRWATTFTEIANRFAR